VDQKMSYHHGLPGTNNATGQGVSHGAQPDVFVGAQLANSFSKIGPVQTKTSNKYWGKNFLKYLLTF